MKASKMLIATLKEAPQEAQIASHTLLLRGGFIKNLVAGVYNYLPFGLRVLNKIEAIIREEMDKSGAIEILSSAVQPKELWEESGRWSKYGAELFRFQDRHDREFCLGPTHEEIFTSMARDLIKSPKQLPMNIYQIQTKYRDEAWISKRDEASASKEEAVDTPIESQSTGDILLQALLKGETINKNKAMSIPAVSSAVDRISNMVAMLPIRLYKEEITDGKRKVVEVLKDGRTKLLNQDTGDTLDPFQLKKAMARDYLIEKGAYIYLEKLKNEFKSIRYVEPTQISIMKNYDPIFKDVKYEVNGKPYETFNFLTILRNTTDGATGKSIVDEISKSLETSFTTILYELGLVKKGGGKKGFLTATKKLGKDEMEKLKQAWKNYYGNNEENVIVLNDGIEFKEGANSSVELQINERKKTLKEDINDVFHISSNYDETVKDAVMPIISAIESALNKNFLLESEKGVFYFAFDTKKITRGSLKERYEAYKIASDTGWLGTNEIRAEEDYDAIDGLDVIKLSLANVLYDTTEKKYYTPNTGALMDMSKNSENGGENNENTG